ncbi:cation diffusion facilitator family transporter [Rhizorhapis sp. SPR117]|uniref:cation diffusion facilitator family transporter n=1 Tax=Rhizorhapis sp. SPR117 TaxID=2912611 RepID=UPI001F288E20|nr:cation diffusion facilitator family transporter [Rhizorhapis sp. SPR117]
MYGHHNHGPQGHSHAPADFGRAFAIGIILNISFVAVETVYGLMAGSMALLADAGHNLSDVLGLVIAWAGVGLAKRRPSRRFTYGLRGSTILSALFNGLLLLVAVGAIAYGAIGRLGAPQPVAGGTVIVVAGIGIVINTATALLFVRGRKGDLNIRGAFLHMAADAAVSLGVVVGALAMIATGAYWIDPVISLVIAAIILWNTWGLLMSSIKMSLAAVPPGIDPEAVEASLVALPGVTHVHDLHIWPMSTTQTLLTVHLVMPDGHPGDAFLFDVQNRLAHDFHIDHATIQIELSDAGDCQLHPACDV